MIVYKVIHVQDTTINDWLFEFSHAAEKKFKKICEDLEDGDIAILNSHVADVDGYIEWDIHSQKFMFSCHDGWRTSSLIEMLRGGEG